jgi:hypothetical protein
MKSVRFQNSPPRIHVVAADMATWQNGEISIGPPKQYVLNAEELTEEALAAAFQEERADRPKSVRFQDSVPEIHIVAADMATWQNGEVSIGPPEQDVHNAEKLTKEAIATALKEERADRRRGTYQNVKQRVAGAKVLAEKKLRKVCRTHKD